MITYNKSRCSNMISNDGDSFHEISVLGNFDPDDPDFSCSFYDNNNINENGSGGRSNNNFTTNQSLNALKANNHIPLISLSDKSNCRQISYSALKQNKSANSLCDTGFYIGTYCPF